MEILEILFAEKNFDASQKNADGQSLLDYALKLNKSESARIISKYQDLQKKE